MTAPAPPTADAATRPRVIVVVGAGRSGTSALCRGLGALGVELGDRLKRATPKNPRGFFEDVDLLRVNKRLHRLFGLRDTGTSVSPVDPAEWQRHAGALETLQTEALGVIRTRFGDCRLWGFKSGGLMRLLPFWEQVLEAADLDASYVVAARNPLNVARSRAHLNAVRGRQEKSDLEWLARVVPYFRRVAARPFVVVDYDRLMADPAGQLERVAHGLALPLDRRARAGIDAYQREFLRPGLRHHREGLDALQRDTRVNPLTRDAYLWLYRLACDEIGPADPALWRDWQRIEAGLELLGPALRHIDWLEARAEGGRLRALGHRLGPALQTLLASLPSLAGTARGGSAGR